MSVKLREKELSNGQISLYLDIYGLTDKKKKLACFVKFFEDYVKARNSNGLYFGILRSLQKFAGKQPVSFVKLSASWMKDLERYLLLHVSNNTALRYLKALNGAMNEAVRKRIINRNPWHDVPHNMRLKMQDVFLPGFVGAM